jgi:hypothetical protein
MGIKGIRTVRVKRGGLKMEGEKIPTVNDNDKLTQPTVIGL